jgi:hypothetical protein
MYLVLCRYDLLQANDKARTGYLAAVQARNLLLQTGLAQQTLATVWNLADIDKVADSRSTVFTRPLGINKHFVGEGGGVKFLDRTCQTSSVGGGGYDFLFLHK